MAEPKTVEIEDWEIKLRNKWAPKKAEPEVKKAEEPKAAEAPKEEKKETPKAEEPEVKKEVKAPEVKKEETKKPEEKTEAKADTKSEEKSYEEKTETAILEAMEVLPEDMRPSEDLVVDAIEKLGKDIASLSDTARASKIIQEALRLQKEKDEEAAPKNELKKKAKMPGSSKGAEAVDDFNKRLNSPDVTVRKGAIKDGIRKHFKDKGIWE
jgi:hypothetical protein